MGGLIARHDVELDLTDNSGSTIYGVVYATHRVALKGEMTITGAVMAGDRVEFRGRAKVTVTLSGNGVVGDITKTLKPDPSSGSSGGIVDWMG